MNDRDRSLILLPFVVENCMWACFLCSVDVVSVSSLGADLRWIAAGASYVISSSANFPVNTQTSLDLANEQLQLKSFLPKAVSYRTVILFCYTLNFNKL